MTSSVPTTLARRVLPAAVLASIAGGLLGRIDSSAGSNAAVTGDDTAAAPASPTLAAPTVLPAGAGALPATSAPASPVTTVEPAPSSEAAGGGCGAVTDGPVVDTRWGPVQVAASVTPDGAVCEVTALESPNSHRKSVLINERALPMLHDRAVAAKTARFDSVTGATITSRAYKKSLQAIIDGAG